MERLGFDYDLVPIIAPVCLTGGPTTSMCVSLKDCESVDLVLMSAVGTAGQDHVIDVQQANTALAGAPKDLDVVTHIFYKTEAVIDGDELWVEQTQPIASEIAITALYPIAEEEDMVVIHIEAADMDFANGFYWVFFTVADTANIQLAAAFAVRTGLNVQRKPSNLRDPNF